jgi:hypothetical protein
VSYGTTEVVPLHIYVELRFSAGSKDPMVENLPLWSPTHREKTLDGWGTEHCGADREKARLGAGLLISGFSTIDSGWLTIASGLSSIAYGLSTIT